MSVTQLLKLDSLALSFQAVKQKRYFSQNDATGTRDFDAGSRIWPLEVCGAQLQACRQGAGDPDQIALPFFRFFIFIFILKFFVRASKVSYFTEFSRELHAFYTSSSVSPASISTSPACPTNIPSITNNSWVTKSKK